MVTDPHALGLYSWAVLALTFYQSVTDLPIRQVAVGAVLTQDGENFLRRYMVLAGISGTVIMVAAIWLISAFTEGRSIPAKFFDLLPLVLVPPAQAFAVRATAALQRGGQWGEVSLWRTTGSLVGMAFGVPVVFITGSVVGACIAVMTSEFVYAVLVGLSARRRRDSRIAPIEAGNPPSSLGATYGHMTVYSVLGWLQAQSSRVFLGAWAGTSALGSYSLGYSIGRSAGDALASSQANVLRVELSRSEAQTDESIRCVLARNLRAGLLMAVATAIGAVVISNVVLSPLLGPEWHAALLMVPILAVTAIPMAVAASSAPVHIQRGNARIAYVGPAVCLLFSPLIAFAAISSLSLAAWTVLARECVLAAIQTLFMGRATPWREVAIAAICVAAGSIAVVGIDRSL